MQLGQLEGLLKFTELNKIWVNSIGNKSLVFLALLKPSVGHRFPSSHYYLAIVALL